MAEKVPFFCSDCDSEITPATAIRKKDGRHICRKCEDKLREKAESKRQGSMFEEQNTLFNPARRRNLEGFTDHNGQFHPIRASKDYNEFIAGDFNEPSAASKKKAAKQEREEKAWQQKEEREIKRSAYGERTTKSLAQYVRKRGGIAPSEDIKGELKRLAFKDTGTTGLINQKARQGSHKQYAEDMMVAAEEEGFGPFDSVSDFLRQVETSAVKGISKTRKRGDTVKQKRKKQDAKWVASMTNPAKKNIRYVVMQAMELPSMSGIGGKDKHYYWTGVAHYPTRAQAQKVVNEIKAEGKKAYIETGVKGKGGIKRYRENPTNPNKLTKAESLRAKAVELHYYGQRETNKTRARKMLADAQRLSDESAKLFKEVREQIKKKNPASTRKLSATRQSLIKKTQALLKQADALEKQGKPIQARTVANKAIALNKRIWASGKHTEGPIGVLPNPKSVNFSIRNKDGQEFTVTRRQAETYLYSRQGQNAFETQNILNTVKNHDNVFTFPDGSSIRLNIYRYGLKNPAMFSDETVKSAKQVTRIRPVAHKVTREPGEVVATFPDGWVKVKWSDGHASIIRRSELKLRRGLKSNPKERKFQVYDRETKRVVATGSKEKMLDLQRSKTVRGEEPRYSLRYRPERKKAQNPTRKQTEKLKTELRKLYRSYGVDPLNSKNYKPVPKKRKRSNPSVKELSKSFLGKVNGKVETLYAGEGAPANLAKAGRLVFLKGKGFGTVKPSGATVAMSTSGKLWIVGSSKRPMFVDRGKAGEALDYGEIDQICYEAAKSHIGGGKRYEYVHTFGEEGGRKPHLLIDSEGMPILRGGDYKIESRGIVN